jgi:two-component system, chemotaxis family, CheB/CheR fusion protein
MAAKPTSHSHKSAATSRKRSPKAPQSRKIPVQNFPIVGIGASAGGLESFTQLLQALPPDTGMAFVLIQHLEPSHSSLLSEILTRTTVMVVHEVQQGMTIAPNCVYVIPPNKRMTCKAGKLNLQPRQLARGTHLPIDEFFQSLATECGNKAIAVVLSGSGSDGAIGITAIQSGGGITFAQAPDSAEFPNMPQNAIATGQIDFVLPPMRIAEELLRISRHPDVILPSAPSPETSPRPTTPNPGALNPKTLSAETLSAETLSAETLSAETLSPVFALLRRAMGVDFTHYKQGTMRRRIMRRMVLCRLERLEDYLQYLQTHPIEVEDLYHDILINVTSFFREPASFEALKNQVFPSLLHDHVPDRSIRVWIPGCATGEEAYSLAINLLEFLADRVVKPPIQIFATDISAVAIEQARSGIYPANRLAEVSPERLRRFFVPTEEGYQISKAVRELCVFACQDLTNDPPFSRLDLISCRNVLIYFEPSLQKKVMPIFHYALNPSGFLMLGNAESIGDFCDLFAMANKTSRIYRRKLVPTRLNFSFMTSQSVAQSPPIAAVVTESWNDLGLAQAADQIVLQRYAPVGVIINAELEILQFRGQTSDYLAPAPGKASLNLFKMARSELALELRSMVHRSAQQDIAVRQTGVQMHVGKVLSSVTLEVLPFASPAGTDRYFLVLFESTPIQPQPTGDDTTAIDPLIANKPPLAQEVQRLSLELTDAKAYLQSIIEAQEASNQELKVANEEILSSNEELQSTNEELETAKEEIQATNEELSTINEELRSRNLQLNRVNSDLQNLLSSVNIPILMLGGDLRIRRFTPMAESLFNLIPTDVGRPFTDIQPNLNLPSLGALVLTVIDTLHTHEQEVQDTTGHWYSLRIRPYKTIDNQIDGAVINLIDIDALKRNTLLLERSRDYATAIVETVREPLVVLNAQLQVVTANQSFYHTFELSPAQVEQQLIFDLGQGEWNVASLRSLLEDILPDNHVLQDFEVNQTFAQLGQRTMLLNACQLRQADSDHQILLAIEDITDRKQAEIQLHKSLQEKEVLLREIRHRVKNNLQVISSLLSLQSSRTTDATAIEILQDSQNRVQTIALMHEVLHRTPNLAELNFADYVQLLVRYVFSTGNLQPDAIAPQVSVPADLQIHPDQAVLCGLIINELVTNALKYGCPQRPQDPAAPAVSVQITITPERQLSLAVSNDGDTLPADFDLPSIRSIGLNLVTNLVEQLNGTLQIDRGKQTRFKVCFIALL